MQDTSVPLGCYCTNTCMAPKIMGRQMPCLRTPLAEMPPVMPKTRQVAWVSIKELREWRTEWLAANDPQDGTDCVTPFDKYLL